ncbi:DUF3450 domain-containing protein [Parahalioglobus pacificus]|uniref:DUF3450 domain-containing protein n=1 Tax=Parahalioglobus pacificus TaxID=930806 RepID=A0A918XK05_9GAMM|nr:DUF3450 domain-containing protein [Halioglobus pacificus]GHD35379.1 DUF3450 domain-containing protein [Halioglobus pacificus]
MTMYRMKKVLFAALVTSVGMVGVAQGNNLESVLKVAEDKNAAARQSQAKVDRLADETRDLLSDYKTVVKQVDGLKVYNARLQRQIDNQLQRIANIDGSIEQVTVIQRQMTPLIIRMVDGLEQFVSLDMPFRTDERMARVAFLRTNLDRADVTVAEKFRQVLEAYNIELQYGRGIDSYSDTVDLDGTPTEVDFLRIGRIALLYQSKDGERSGAWDKEAGAWVPLSAGDYNTAIRKGIRIAKKQATIDLLNIPVAAPESN